MRQALRQLDGELGGLYRRSPLLSMNLILGIFALAGVPPSIGFTGKLLLFTSAMNEGYFWLVLIGAVNGSIPGATSSAR